MIKLRQFSCGYPGRPVLAQANLDFLPGKITVVIGQNGSGKSTLAQVLAGLKLDFRGEVWLDDLKLKHSTPIDQLRQKVGLVLQNPDHQILFDRVDTEISFALQNLGLPKVANLPKKQRAAALKTCRRAIIKHALAQVNLVDYITANPQELSGGQKQRLALASVLALQPRYLILDEVTSMLDLPSRRAVYDILENLRAQNIGIIFMTNALEEILLADSVVLLDRGKVYTYSPEELIQDTQILPRHGLETPILLQVAKKFKANNLHDLRVKL